MPRHLLQIPGPTNVPDRVLAAIARPTIDHRGPEFADLVCGLLPDLARVFRTEGPVVIYPSSGTGAWEAALVNVLAPGDRVLAFETGHFAALWVEMARHFGLDADVVATDWRHGADPEEAHRRLSADRDHSIKAVMVVHNETSTGVTSRIAEIRAAIDAANHPALLLVDTISSLASIDFRHDEWGVDVTVAGSQKGLMLPPGLGFNAISEKALHLAQSRSMPRSYFDWAPILEANRVGRYPYTPATNLLVGLRQALDMLLDEEGLDAVFTRHARHARAARAAVRGWGLEVLCRDEREHSNALTAVLMPDHHDADDLRKLILQRFDMSLGAGLGRWRSRVFRIGHLGDVSDLMLAATLAGVEMGLQRARVDLAGSGVAAALQELNGSEN